MEIANVQKELLSYLLIAYIKVAYICSTFLFSILLGREMVSFWQSLHYTYHLASQCKPYIQVEPTSPVM